MDERLKILSIVVVSAFAVYLFSASASAVTLFSPSFNFTVSQNAIALNHTNGFNQTLNITINNTFGAGNMAVINLTNTSTLIVGNYSQPLLSLAACGSGGGGMKPAFHNSTHFIHQVALYTGQQRNVSVFLAYDSLACSPGRWEGGLDIVNATNVNDFVRVNVTVDIPITSSGSFNTTTNGTSSFSGTMPLASGNYHSYYINSSAVPNSSSFNINFTGDAGVHIFLFDNSGVLRAKDVSNNSLKTIVMSDLPNNTANTFWELRLYANQSASSAYSGSLVFSTLNASNSTSNRNSLSYSVMTPGTVNSTNILLANNGSIQQNAVFQSSEVAFVKTFAQTNGVRDYFLFMPDSVTRIVASVNWTGSAGQGTINYTIGLMAPNGSFIANSSNNYLAANASQTVLENFVDTNQTSSGMWRVFVHNATTPSGGTNNYHVTVKAYFNSSNWISTNFTSGSNFNPNQQSGSSQTVNLNLTVPVHAVDGSYEGFVAYSAAGGATVRMPMRFNVQAGSMVVNNTLNSSTYDVKENIGYNFTRTFQIPLNNTGSVSLSFTNNTHSGVLFSSGNTSRNISFFYNVTNTSAAMANQTLDITVNATPSNTSDAQGFYSGWIFLSAPASSPSQGHNFTMRLNLTSALEVAVADIFSADKPTATTDRTVNDTNVNETMTFRFQARYANNTLISSPEVGMRFNLTNTSILLRHANVTSTVVQITNLTNASINGVTSLFSDSVDSFDLNGTVPANTLGGHYDVVVGASDHRNGTTLIGNGTFKHLVVNNVSLLMSSNASGCSVGSTSCSTNSIQVTEGATSVVTAFITNYGPVAVASSSYLPSSSLGINFSETCSSYSVAVASENCTGTGSANGPQWTGITPAAGETCFVSWTVTAINDSSACGGTIQAATGSGWFNNNGVVFNIDVEDNSTGSSGSSSSTTSSGSSESSTTTAATTTAAAASASAPKYLQITKWGTLVEVLQGESKTATVTVKNVNDSVSQSVSVSVTDMNTSITSKVSPSSADIADGGSSDFTVTFDVPESVGVESYPGKFKATSSRESVSVDFNLHVLPGAEAKVLINTTLSSLETQMLELWKEINKTRSSGGNVSASESLFFQLKSKVDEAKAFVGQGTDQGYFAASETFEQIRTMLETTRSQLKVDKQSAGFSLPTDILLYVGIAAGVAVAGVLVYLFLPTGAKGGFKLGMPAKGTITDRIANIGSDTKDKFSGIAGGTKDAVSGAAGSTVDKFKNLQEKFRLKKEYKYKYSE